MVLINRLSSFSLSEVDFFHLSDLYLLSSLIFQSLGAPDPVFLFVSLDINVFLKPFLYIFYLCLRKALVFDRFHQITSYILYRIHPSTFRSHIQVGKTVSIFKVHAYSPLPFLTYEVTTFRNTTCMAEYKSVKGN